jgi:histidine triad (HIT) family protein
MGRSAMAVSGLPPYDETNIFARILRGEIPCKKAYEDQWALAFHDINPLAPVHVLVIPKGNYVSFADFSATASAEEIAGFMRAVAKLAKDLGLEVQGYRLLTNMGTAARRCPTSTCICSPAGRWGGCWGGHRPQPGIGPHPNPPPLRGRGGVGLPLPRSGGGSGWGCSVHPLDHLAHARTDLAGPCLDERG